MSVPGKILDGDKGQLEVHVHRFSTAGRDDHAGLLSLTDRFLKFDSEFHPFLNDTFGTAMNQDVTFGGIGLRATILHAGINSGSADSGTTDGTFAFRLLDTSQNFQTTVGPGALVHNTTDTTFALVTTVSSDNQLILDTDIIVSGEDYVINDIWPGTAVQGTWDFASAGKFTITDANDNDEATFTVDSAHIWNATQFVSFTGKVDLDTYNATNNSILLEFGLNGVLVGNSINLNDFIDTGDFAEQSFVIPKEDFGLDVNDFNSMRLTITRTGGARPDIKFDDFQWENTGTPIVYKATTGLGERFHITEIRIRIEDVISSVLTDGSMPNIDPSALLGVSTLTNGIVFSRVQRGVTLFSVTLKELGDFFATGSNAVNITGNATNTGLTLVVTFPEPIILEGRSDEFLSFTINDDLRGLTRFTAAARGAVEIDPDVG